MTVANKPGRWGERAISRKPLRGEGRMIPVEPVVLPPCFFCTGPMGAIGTRLSPRPLNEEGGTSRPDLAPNRRRECGAVFAVLLRSILRDARQRVAQISPPSS
jgi:hypothetical protein